MKGIATTAMAALLAAGAAQAQQPGQRQAQRPPAQAQRQPAPPAAGPTIPTRVTAKMLSDLCAQDRGACLGYIVGSTDSWASAMAAAGRPQVICIPAGANNDQVTQATVRYIRANPQEGGLNAAVVIFAALKTTFPCGY
jgi:Ssp1 endopeptidase immunity protein Rap1a